MKKILALGVGAIGSFAVVLTLGSGLAWADDGVVGQTFNEAKAALGQQGLTAVVASTVGDRKDWGSCIVTSATKAPVIDGFGKAASGKMNVNLNCYAENGTSSTPGFSVASPEGQKQYQLDQTAKKQKEAEAAAAAGQSTQDELAATDAQQAGE